MIKYSFFVLVVTCLSSQAISQTYQWITGNVQTEAIRRDLCPCEDIRKLYYFEKETQKSTIVCLENLQQVTDGEISLFGYFDSCKQFVATKSADSLKHKKPYTLQYIGKFESYKGVKHPLSQFGYNIGILSLNGSEQNPEFVTICFDKLPNSTDLEIPENITVEGYYETVVVTPNENESHPVYVNPMTGIIENTVITERVFYVTRIWKN
jgi:hypothetical protein